MVIKEYIIYIYNIHIDMYIMLLIYLINLFWQVSWMKYCFIAMWLNTKDQKENKILKTI